MLLLNKCFALSKPNLVSNIYRPILSHFSINTQILSSKFDSQYELKDVHLAKSDLIFKTWADHMYQAIHELNLVNQIKNNDVNTIYDSYSGVLNKHPLIDADGHTGSTFITALKIARLRLIVGDENIANNYGINICILEYPFR